MTLIDLSIPWGTEIEPVPNNPRIFYAQINHHELQGYSTAYAAFSIHTGTHVDAPYHFIKNGLTMEQVPLEWLNGPAVLLDLRTIARPKQPLTVDALKAAAGSIADLRGKRLVLWTGWAQEKWAHPAFYRDNPYLSNEAAQWLVDVGARALGVDFAVDGGPPKPPGQPKYPVHVITLGADVCLIENLINLEKIGRRQFALIAMPIPVKGGNGGPARVAAWVDG